MTTHQLALNMCQVALAGIKKQSAFPMTRDDISASVDQVLMMQMFKDSVDREQLITDLEQIFTVWSNDPTVLGSDDDHVPWLAQRRVDIEWRFWDRYRLFMIQRQKLTPAAVETIEKVTDEVLGRLEDPGREGSWDRRGLVMGNVQSGKTATYTGLICKAADAGYKVIVVLAGLHNNLRSQTQIRLDEGFLGYKAAAPGSHGATFEPTGVSEFGTNAKADSVTNRTDLGDFSKRVARSFGIHPGGNPLLFVVKKNATVLKNLLGWIHHSADAHDVDTGRKFHRQTPLLLIDDEADQASVDTKAGAFDEHGQPDPDHDPTKINRLIRSLLFSFEKSAYVGFTATPFANIYIHEQAVTKELGDDLFPRSFIVNLPAPSNYAGAARLFGIVAEEQAGLDEIKPLPLVRPVDDHADSDQPQEIDGWMPPRLVAKTGHVPSYDGKRQVPPSLRKALMSFVLSTVVRSIREPDARFNSMLIHVVRFTNVQDIVREEVERELKDFLTRLQYGDGDRKPGIWEEFKGLWDSDYCVTTSACGGDLHLPPWSAVTARLPRIAATVVVRSINGSALDALDYEQHSETGLNVVAVGGDKLSRGLTLEGLTVSYFLRSSRMYDTLMQMGRWFGYKDKYLDVCRLYTTKELQTWFKHIAAATEELRLEFDYMVNVGATPRDYGLKVRSHSLMTVTSAVKMRSGTELSLSYAGDISETVTFDIESAHLQNLRSAQALVRSLGDPEKGGAKSKGYTWKGVSVDAVLQFLDAYLTDSRARRADSRLLSSYIKRQNQQNELNDWTVLLISSSDAGAKSLSGYFDGRDVWSVKRQNQELSSRNRYAIRRLVNPRDEIRDLEEDEIDRALKITCAVWETSQRKDKSPTAPTTPSPRSARQVRPKQRGLLMLYPLDGGEANTTNEVPVIGMAISFPASDSAKPIKYTVNNVFTELGDYDDF